MPTTTVYLIEIIASGKHRSFAATTLDARAARRWRRDFNRVSQPLAQAVIHPVSAAIRTAKAKSRSA